MKGLCPELENVTVASHLVRKVSGTLEALGTELKC